MAKEVLVGQTLTNEMIEAGKSTVLYLDQKRIIIASALWFYIAKSMQWRLVIGTPEVRIEGPRKVYKHIQKALAGMPDPKLQLRHIAVVNSDDPLISLLKAAIRTGPGISGIRFTNNVINGVPIEDAYIYRLS